MQHMLYKNFAIDEIKKVAVQAREYFTKYQSRDKNYGVDQSTFRAYRKFRFKPSDAYREWAHEVSSDNIFFNDAVNIASYDDFKLLHSNTREWLASAWKKKQGRELDVPYINKLIDLYFKYIAITDIREDSNIATNIASYGHVPLDKYSLLAIKYLFYGIVLSKNPSMGDVTEMETYYFLQDQIRSLMNAADLPNLYFDYYAWNAKH